MTEKFPPDPNVENLPSADVTFSEEKEQVKTTVSHPVLIPKEYIEDSMIQIRSSSLKRWTSKIKKVENSKINYSDLFLSLGMVGAGAIISALLADIKIDSTLGIIFYVVVPVVSAICLAIFYFKRKENSTNIETILADLIEEMPNPDEAEPQKRVSK